MRLDVFQADKGDCLLVTGRRGERVLVDGGMRDSYRRHVAPALGRIAQEGGKLDLVCVSHVDRDHIAGILQLLEDEIAWRVRDFQHRTGNTSHPDPERPRPPGIERIWHNAFHDVIPDNAGPIEEALAASAAVLQAGEAERDVGHRHRDLATSIAEGLRLSARLGPRQLGIPLNAEFAGRLAMVRSRPKTVELGSLRLTLIGPFAADLERLRERWNQWLTEHDATVERLRDRMERDARRLGLGELDRFRRAIESRASELAARDHVTVENLVSIMLLVEDGEHTILLTGDGHESDVRKGLRAAGRLRDGGTLHVDVLKVPHHGSEHNVETEAFCREVTADHYVFCANGKHHNPDLAVLELIFRVRTEADGDGPAARRPFRFWFSSSPSASTSDEGRAHMAKVRALVDDLVARSGGRLTATYLDDASFEVA